jgi:hypothetical protein
MIVWTGLGYMVVVIVFGCSLAANFIFNATYGDGYYDQHKWPVALSLVISAFFCKVLGDYLKQRSDRIVIDKKTGEELVINRSSHTLFWIPMHYWGPILFIMALVLFGLQHRN